MKLEVIVVVGPSLLHFDRFLGALAECDLTSDLGFVFVVNSSFTHSLDVRKIVKKLVDLPNLRFVNLYYKRRIGIARNVGLRVASAEYVTFFDCDDYCTAGYFTYLLTQIRVCQNADVIRFSHLIDRSGNLILKEFDRPLGIQSMEDRFRPVYGYALVDSSASWSGIYRLGFLRDFQIYFMPLRSAEDRAFVWTAALFASKYYYSGFSGYCYDDNINPLRLTKSRSVGQFDVLLYISRFSVFFRRNSFPRYVKQKFIMQSLAMMDHHWRGLDLLSSSVRRRVCLLSSRALEAMILLPEFNFFADEILDMAKYKYCKEFQAFLSVSFCRKNVS